MFEQTRLHYRELLLLALATILFLPSGAVAKIKVDGDAKLNKAVDECIQHMKKTGGTAAQIVEELEKSDHEIIIETGRYSTSFLSQCDSMNAYKATHPESGGTGSIISWGYTSKFVLPDGVQEVPCKTLLHEMKHAADAAKGKLDLTPGHNGIEQSEIDATKAENEFRNQQKPKHPCRTKYGDAGLPEDAIPRDDDEDGGVGGGTADAGKKVGKGGVSDEKKGGQ